MSDPAGPVGRADVIFRGARVIDGTGAPSVEADVAVAGDRITAVGELSALTAEMEIDAAGKALTPGFIDVHTHDDRYLLTNPEVAPKTSQGVTTVVVGNCGISVSPLRRHDSPPPPLDLLADRAEYRFRTVDDYFDRLDRAPAAVNSLTLIGHTTLRYNVMDDLDRTATDREIDGMRALMSEAIEAGAIGMSSGLFYPPARAASTDEVARVAETLAERDAIYTAHIRNEDDHVTDAIEEAAEIARRAGVQLVISHHKTSQPQNFGRTRETLPLIDGLRADQRIGLDVYPYIAGSTVLLPEMVEGDGRVIVTWCTDRPELAGRDLDEIAREMGLDRVETARALLPAGAIYFMMDEADVQRILAFPHAMIGSDGIPDDAHPHPRLWGTFPRVLGHYARDLGIFSLEEAVRRMTGLPAAEFGLKDRGTIAPGYFADLVLFDPATIVDRADFGSPKQPAAGIDQVLVNGEPVWRDGSTTGRRPGRAIRLQDTNRGAG